MLEPHRAFLACIEILSKGYVFRGGQDHFLETLASTLADIDAVLPARSGLTASDIVRSELSLLVQGKSNFDAIENMRGDKFFKQAPGIGLLASSPTL